MAIAFRSTSTGSSTNSTTSTISLPAGTTTGDVTVMFAQQASPATGASGAVPTMTAPSGWTVLNAVNGVIVCWRAYQAGDPSTGITFTSSLTNWWESLAVTYSGCDTTAPIDASCACWAQTANTVSATKFGFYRAPSILPNFNADVLLTLASNGGSSGGTITPPGGVTQRANTSVGPALNVCEKVLTDGSPTGDFDATGFASANDSHFGMSIALKTAGATAATLAAPRPTFGALWNYDNNAASFTVPLDHLGVQNGDLVLLFTSGLSSVSLLSGWTQLAGSVQGARIFYRTWSIGDSTTPAFTVTGGNYVSADAVVLRKAGASAINPTIDTSGINSATGTVSTPSLTPAAAAEMLLAYFGTRVANAGTWSGVTAGLNNIDINTVGPCLRLSSLTPSGNPTIAYSATFSLGGTIDAAAVLVAAASVAAPVTARQYAVSITV